MLTRAGRCTMTTTPTRRDRAVRWSLDADTWSEVFPHLPPDVATPAQCACGLRFFGDGWSLDVIAAEHGVTKQTAHGHLRAFTRRVENIVTALWGDEAPPRSWTLAGANTSSPFAWPADDAAWTRLQRRGPEAGSKSQTRRKTT